MNRSLLACVLFFGIGAAAVAITDGAEISTLAPQIDAGADTGLIFNRGERTEPVPPGGECPGGVCPVPRTAPVFEAPPVAAIPPSSGPVAAPQSAVAITPEQKEALKGLLMQAVTLLIGAFMGSGSASPFIRLILEKLLGAVGGATPVVPGATPVAVRRRVAKKKAAKKPAPAPKVAA